MAGTFYGIGVGPGDPKLLTVMAVEALEKTDVIIAPRTEKKEGSVAYSAAKPYLKKDIEVVYQVFPMVKGFQESTPEWDENTKEIKELLEQGKNVTFLTIGDPMFYSTYIYIFERLVKAGVTPITIPGIMAFGFIGSKMNMPLVMGDDIFSVIPATAPRENIEKALKTSNNIVMMKVYKNFPEVIEMLKENGFLDDAVMVSRAGLPDEMSTRDIEGKGKEQVNYLTTIIAKRKH